MILITTIDLNNGSPISLSSYILCDESQISLHPFKRVFNRSLSLPFGSHCFIGHSSGSNTGTRSWRTYLTPFRSSLRLKIFRSSTAWCIYDIRCWYKRHTNDVYGVFKENCTLGNTMFGTLIFIKSSPKLIKDGNWTAGWGEIWSEMICVILYW